MSRALLATELAIAIVIAVSYLALIGVSEPLAAIGLALLMTAAHVGLSWLWPRRQPSEPVAAAPSHDEPAMQALVAMVAELQHAREQIHRTALEVASAAAEIEASIGTQVLAARRQVDGVTEVSAAIERLSSSTSMISSVSTKQLEHAEQARTQAEDVAGRIAALQQSITRIAALLEQISEIASRSDLLALNGSLEATHAGEAGRAFALIATEMRRLAERVGTLAADVRGTVDEIASTHADSLRAARDSREFAERSAEVARRVHELARVQAAESKLVDFSVHEIAEIAARSDAAASESRAAANSLHEQARALERLLRQTD